ncbi:MAG: hypothetical protein OXU67_01765 [Chloroflexota bacterium]|nr:hypothetical protein [Chloroflexota bacterium]
MNRASRESIWSVPARWQTIYFTLFNVCFIAGTALTISQECCLDHSSDGAVKSLLDIIQGGATAAIFSAAVALVVTEGWTMLSTMLSTILTRKTEEYLAKRYEQGRTEALAAVEQWNRRRLAAEAKGESFDEPLPSATERSAE